MASQVFYRKWRSQTLSELVGQKHVTQTLLNALKSGNISHAYLFCGPRGTGKTSTARILAKAVNCLNNNGRGEPCNQCEMCRAITEDRAMDVIEIDAASNRGIDDIRDLREKVNYAPTQARRKVYIIDEFHMLSKDASNALLKTLEEPPPHVIFILATTESHKVLPTILSRCQHFDFHRLSRTDVVNHLKKISASEKINIEDQSLQLIAKNTTGSLRDALNMLEQLTTYYGNDVQFQQVQSMLGITGDSRAKEIVKHILNNNLQEGMAVLSSVNSDGLDIRQFNREIVEYLRDILLIKTGAANAVDVTLEDINDLKTAAENALLPNILQAVKLFGQINISDSDNSTLPLELALVECSISGTAQRMSENKPAAGQQVKESPAKQSDTVNPKPDKLSEENKSEIKQNSADNAQSTRSSQVQESFVQQKPVENDNTAENGKIDFNGITGNQGLSSEIERLRLNWQDILDSVPGKLKRTNALALLRSSGIKPVAIENDVVVLSLKYPIHKKNMEKPEYQQVAERIISDYLGHPCNIRCVCETENNHMVKAAIKRGARVINVEEK
jgi:DNA polymerase III subunit gamma/tau